MTLEKLPPVHPGQVLLEDFLKPLGLTAEAAEAGMCINPGILQSVIDGNELINADLALALAIYLGTDAETWLNLQHQYEIARIDELNEQDFGLWITPFKKS